MECSDSSPLFEGLFHGVAGEARIGAVSLMNRPDAN